MKKYSVIFLMTICTIFMLGCSNYIEIMSKGNSTNNSWTSEYKMFSGSKSKRVNLYKDQVIKFDVVSENGDLEVTIEDESGDTCFSKKITETSIFEFTPEISGKYKIKLDAKNHKGSFDVSWRVNDSK